MARAKATLEMLQSILLTNDDTQMVMASSVFSPSKVEPVNRAHDL
jgi:hypothetical protein